VWITRHRSVIVVQKTKFLIKKIPPPDVSCEKYDKNEEEKEKGGERKMRKRTKEETKKKVKRKIY
jgi:hypothetical protein